MSNRRVKSLEYDDDDLEYDDLEEEYEEEGDLTAEDKEQLRVGTIEVRKVLGPGYQVSDKEIQDSLWNYYYDIQKTVNHIKSEFYRADIVQSLTSIRQAKVQSESCESNKS